MLFDRIFEVRFGPSPIPNLTLNLTPYLTLTLTLYPTLKLTLNSTLTLTRIFSEKNSKAVYWDFFSEIYEKVSDSQILSLSLYFTLVTFLHVLDFFILEMTFVYCFTFQYNIFNNKSTSHQLSTYNLTTWLCPDI